MDIKAKVIWTQRVMSPKLNSYPVGPKPWGHDLRISKNRIQYSDYYIENQRFNCVALANLIIEKHAQDRGEGKGVIRDDDQVKRKIESLTTKSSFLKERRSISGLKKRRRNSVGLAKG